MKLGFIGQGFIGKNYADEFERRGYSVVRYALEAEYTMNKTAIAECDIVFIAVPTPSTPAGFDSSIVEEVISLVGDGKVAVIKSTVTPGTTRKIQDANPHKIVLFSPEFLLESTAAYDAAHPIFNVLGVSYNSAGHQKAAEKVLKILPQTDHNFIVQAHSAELFKYIHNLHGYMRVVFANLMYDVAQDINVEWSDVKPIMDVDPWMSFYYNSPHHKSGRGAGGSCFVKDMAAFIEFYKTVRETDKKGLAVFEAMEAKNLELLAATNKSQDIVASVYGTSTNKVTKEQPAIAYNNDHQAVNVTPEPKASKEEEKPQSTNTKKALSDIIEQYKQEHSI